MEITGGTSGELLLNSHLWDGFYLPLLVFAALCASGRPITKAPAVPSHIFGLA
jgi:hypothetical protein